MPHVITGNEALVILFCVGLIFVAVLFSLIDGDFDHDNW
jgi:hypothetical protein